MVDKTKVYYEVTDSETDEILGTCQEIEDWQVHMAITNGYVDKAVIAIAYKDKDGDLIVAGETRLLNKGRFDSDGNEREQAKTKIKIHKDKETKH